MTVYDYTKPIARGKWKIMLALEGGMGIYSAELGEAVMMKLKEAQAIIESIGVAELPGFLRSWRERVRLNQLTLAKLSGVPQSNIYRIEDGEQGVTPRTFRRLWGAIEKAAPEVVAELGKEVSSLRGVQDAASYMAMCSALPWLRSQLPAAEAKLAEKKAEAVKLSGTDALSDPIVSGLLDSLYREKEGLEKQVSEMQVAALKSFVEQFAAEVAMQFAEKLTRRDPQTVADFEHWKATGEAPIPRIESIEKIGEVEGSVPKVVAIEKVIER